MFFSVRGPLAVALAASLASATPLSISTPVTGSSLNVAKPVSVNVNIDNNWSHKALVEGVVVGAAVPPVAAVGAEVDLAVICRECYTRGDIDASVSLEALVPSLSLSLTDIEAYLDLEVQLGVATTIAVNLFTPSAPIELPLAGLKVSALIYLDLVLSVDAALDFTGGIWIKLAEKALLETNILSGELLKTEFSGLGVKTLPIEVRIGCATLQADLRLRVQLAAVADVDVGLLGLDLPNIGAGVELGVYANLVEYVGLFCDTPSCPVSKESYGLNVGAIAELDVEVEDILSLDLAPTVSVGLLTWPTVTLCEHGQRPTKTASVSKSATASLIGASVSVSTATIGSYLPTGSASVSNSATASLIGGASFSMATPTFGSHVPTITSSVVGIATGSGSGSGSGSSTASGSGSGSSTASGSGSGSSTASGSGLVVPTITSDSGYGSGQVTSTVRATTTYVITKCAASVANCPASYASEQTVVKTVDVYTTVCPASLSLTAPASTSQTYAASSYPTSAVTVVTTDATVLVPCSSVHTFTPPTGVPTVPAKATSVVYATATAKASHGHSGSQTQETYPASGSSTAIATESYPVSYPGNSKSTPAAYPTYPVISKGYNTTIVYVQTSTAAYTKPSASVYYQTSATSPIAGYPTKSPVTAGAGKAASAGFASVLMMVGAAFALI